MIRWPPPKNCRQSRHGDQVSRTKAVALPVGRPRSAGRSGHAGPWRHRRDHCRTSSSWVYLPLSAADAAETGPDAWGWRFGCRCEGRRVWSQPR